MTQNALKWPIKENTFLLSTLQADHSSRNLSHHLSMAKPCPLSLSACLLCLNMGLPLLEDFHLGGSEGNLVALALLAWNARIPCAVPTQRAAQCKRGGGGHEYLFTYLVF